MENYPKFTKEERDEVDVYINEINQRIKDKEFTTTSEIREWCKEKIPELWEKSGYLRFFVEAM